jgi:hypothetical protein
MRTTLAIDDDVLAAAKGIASMQGKSVGAVISALAREALAPQSTNAASRNGVPLLPQRPGSSPVTPQLVKQLRDELSE